MKPITTDELTELGFTQSIDDRDLRLANRVIFAYLRGTTYDPQVTEHRQAHAQAVLEILDHWKINDINPVKAGYDTSETSIGSVSLGEASMTFKDSDRISFNRSELTRLPVYIRLVLTEAGIYPIQPRVVG